MKIKIVLIALCLLLGVSSRDVFAVSWQCPGHEPVVELKKVDSLEFIELDRYRGYKPAWMALDRRMGRGHIEWETCLS